MTSYIERVEKMIDAAGSDRKKAIRLDVAREILRNLEWSSSRQAAQPRGLPSLPGVIFKACPVCGGVEVTEASHQAFMAKDLHHSANCPFLIALDATGEIT